MRERLEDINVKNVLIYICLASIYFTSAKLSLNLAFINASASAVWPPTGIAIAALVVLGYRFWPAIFLGAFLANFTTAGTFLTSLGIATGNTLEGVVGAYLLNRFAHGKYAFEKPQDIFRFSVVGLVVPLISATIGVCSLALTGLASSTEIVPVWITWWLGDATGALIVAPFLIILNSQPFPKWSFMELIERLSLLIILVIVSHFTFGGIPIFGVRDYPIDFIVFPVLLWVAFRFGVLETATATLILSAIAIFDTLQGFGPFIRSSPNRSLLLLQSFTAVVTITKVMVAAVIAQRKELDKLKDEFVSLASHQLRTPLTTIKWYTEMLIAGRTGNNGENQKDYLNEVYKGNQRMIDLVNDLLDVSRVERGAMVIKAEIVDLRKIIESILEDLRANILARNLHINVKYEGNVEVKIDPKVIKMILQNLISNSVKYTMASGSIDLNIEVLEGNLFIDIIDSGVGIPQKAQKEIFTKLYRADNVKKVDTKGTGLGLYLIKSLVDQSNGEISFSSIEGKGTKFKVKLPLES